jgi:hypothetical protein
MQNFCCKCGKLKGEYVSLKNEVELQQKLDNEMSEWMELCPHKEVLEEMETDLDISYNNNRARIVERRHYELQGDYDESAFENFRDEEIIYQERKDDLCS